MLKTYKKLIEENEGDFQDAEQLEDFLDAYTQDNQDLESQDDNLHEYADGLVPIYYNDIIKEWTDNGQCHGDANEQGLIEGVTDPHKIMQCDLYTMYYDSLSGDYQKFVDLVDIEESDEETDED